MNIMSRIKSWNDRHPDPQGFWPERGTGLRFWNRFLAIVLPMGMMAYAGLFEADSNSVGAVFYVAPLMMVFFLVQEQFNQGLNGEGKSLFWAMWWTLMIQSVCLLPFSVLALNGHDLFRFTVIRAIFVLCSFWLQCGFAMFLYGRQQKKLQEQEVSPQ